jgi:chromosome partitioning protein
LTRFLVFWYTGFPETTTFIGENMTIITVTGYKGGVGKSTTAIHLATFFSERGKTILVDGDPNRTAMAWSERGELPFMVADQRQAIKVIGGAEFIVIDTPARPDSNDLKELAEGCDLLILPTAPDILSLSPMLETASDLKSAKYRALLTVVPPHPSKEGEIMQTDLREGGIPIFNTMIRRTVGFPKAALAGKAIRDLDDPRLKAAWEDYNDLGKEILEILK